MAKPRRAEGTRSTRAAALVLLASVVGAAGIVPAAVAKRVPEGGRPALVATKTSSSLALPDDSGFLLPAPEERLREQIRTAEGGPTLEAVAVRADAAPEAGASSTGADLHVAAPPSGLGPDREGAVDPVAPGTADPRPELDLAGAVPWGLALGALGALALVGFVLSRRRRSRPIAIGSHRSEGSMILRRPGPVPSSIPLAPEEKGHASEGEGPASAPAPVVATASSPASSTAMDRMELRRVDRLESSLLSLVETVRELSERIPATGSPVDEGQDWEHHLSELLDLEPTHTAVPAVPTGSEARAELCLSPWEHFLARNGELTGEVADGHRSGPEAVPADPTSAEQPDAVRSPGSRAVRRWVRSRPETRRAQPGPRGGELAQMRDDVLDLAGRGVPLTEICEQVGLGPHEVRLILRTLFEDRRACIPTAESGTNGR